MDEKVVKLKDLCSRYGITNAFNPNNINEKELPVNLC